MQIKYLKIFDTNYIWLIQNNLDLIVIDPGQFEIVSNYIIANKLHLRAILLTHNHWDHVSGVSEMVSKYNIPVYASENLEPAKDWDISNMVLVRDNDILNILPGTKIKVLATPGHTLDGVSYLVHNENKTYLFCGDTLFSGGCGRVFTNDYALMLKSLDKLKNLSADVIVYPGHEYTLNNLNFAKFIEPDNENIQLRLKETPLDNITLPTTIAKECLTNPFLRIDELKSQIADIAGKKLMNRVEAFKALRDLKDNFT